MSFFSSLSKQQLIGLLVILGLIIGIAFAVYSTQRQQTIRSRADQIKPDPLAPECNDLEHHPKRSILQNGQFEGGFTGGVPNGWTKFISGNASVNEETGYNPFGRNVRIEVSGTSVGGIYQTVSGLQPGHWYHAFYGVAQRVSGNRDGTGERVDNAWTALKEVGVDLNGGTDPNASDVIWGDRSTGGQADYDARHFAGWRFLGDRNNPLVTFYATNPEVTIFIKVTGYPDITWSMNWIDAAYLVPSCQNGSFPPPGGSATPTPSPITSATPGPSDSSESCPITSASISASCAECILASKPALRASYDFFDLQSCSASKIISNWCQEFNPTTCQTLKQSCGSSCQ